MAPWACIAGVVKNDQNSVHFMIFYPPDRDIWWYLECITNPLLWSLVITEEVHDDKQVKTMPCNGKDVQKHCFVTKTINGLLYCVCAK